MSDTGTSTGADRPASDSSAGSEIRLDMRPIPELTHKPTPNSASAEPPHRPRRILPYASVASRAAERLKSATAPAGVPAVAGRPVREETVRTACLLVLAIIAVGAALYMLRPVLVPFVLAVFLMYVILPVVGWMRVRFGLPRWAAIVLAFVGGGLAAAAFLLLVVVSVQGVVQNADDYVASFNRLITRTGAWADEIPGLSEAQLRDYVEPRIQTWAAATATGMVGQAAGLFGDGLLVAIFLLFLLLGRSDQPVRPDSLRGQIELKVNGYIVVNIGVSLLTGVLVGLTLALLGVPLAWLFGVAAFVLNFIPTIGSIIATLLPLPLVLLNPELSTTVKVLAFALPAVIQFVVGNIIAPKLMGDSLDLSPVAVLLALILFGLLWGIPGMILATPMLSVVKIVFERIELLRPVARALGSGGGMTA